MDVVTLETPQLGNRSHLLHDGGEGLVVDPVRDVERVEAAAERAGVRIVAVAETHIHNDYVSGGLALARRHAADYLVAAGESVAFDRSPIRPGVRFGVGGVEVEALATPGHTPHHLAFLARPGGGAAPALFSGGSLLYGTVGRTDLLGADLAPELTRQQYRSVRGLIERLPPITRLFPTHGFGSFCATRAAPAYDAGTLGEEGRRNDAMAVGDEDSFVATLLAGLGPYPRYYGAMADRNRAGATGPDLRAVPELEPDRLRRRAVTGTVVDLRDRARFAGGHLPGSIGLEYATSFATYLGWILPLDTELVLIGDSSEQILDARRDLARIGVERIGAAGATPIDETVHGPLASYPRARWEDLPRETFAGAGEAVGDRVLDVRRRDEYGRAHVDGALCVPIHELPERIDDLPDGQLWVHCHSGYRASIAASLLCRAGRAVVHLDDDFDRAESAGVRIARPVQP
jgi:hydroxyacylglutathione hydrolase